MKKGFTLIELLVVIAIIGILSGIVLTSLNSARLRSKDGRVISNLRQAKTLFELNRLNGNAPAITALLTITDLAKLRQDVCAQQGITCNTNSLNTMPAVSPYKYPGIFKLPTTPLPDYCLYAWLPSSKSDGWNKAACMDSKGKTNFNYTGPNPCGGANSTCL